MGGYFFGLLKFQIFFGVHEIPDIFWMNGRYWAEPTYEEKMKVPTPPPREWILGKCLMCRTFFNFGIKSIQSCYSHREKQYLGNQYYAFGR